MHFISTVGFYVGETTRNPGFPGLGAVVAWWICSRNKRNPIGGWLLYLYWNLYAGFLVSLLFIGWNVYSYVPEYSGPKNYLLFLLSSTPTIVLLFVQVIVATFLLSVRTPEVLKLVRWTFGLATTAGAVGMIVDYFYSPENMILGSLALISDFCWWIYLLRSERVKHVFELNDWEVAVNSIHPAPSLAR